MELLRQMLVVVGQRLRTSTVVLLNVSVRQSETHGVSLYHTSTVKRNAYLAFDLGAESGRAVVGHLVSGVLTMNEVHRFANTPLSEGESQRWDVASLWREMRAALSLISGDQLSSIGVDTWGVDYALLGAEGELLAPPRHYRDPRNVAAMSDALRVLTTDEIYAVTGVQFLPINTLYQLVAAQRHTPRLVADADRFVMMPDLFNLWLTGRAVCELTNASTTQMLNAVDRTWATPLIERLGLPTRIAPPLVEPGSVIGPIIADVAGNTPLRGTPVVASASHDTASAVAAISARDNTAFISSGTWSLVGMEIDAPVLTHEAMRLNFSNEAGVCHTTRLLKNVMGLWILQGCRTSWSDRGRDVSYGELVDAARREPSFGHLVDPDDGSFLAPDDMPAAIDRFCVKTDQPCPTRASSYTRAILESLALKYRLVIRDLEKITGRRIEQVRVIGGGSKNRMLNQFTADAVGVRVVAGPAEATALGNIAVQILATGGVSSIAEARAIIDRSFPTEIFEPQDVEPWNREAGRFQHYCALAYA
jgi:rhamnulokinase